MKRAKSNEEVHLVKLMFSLFKQTTYLIGDHEVIANKGVSQGSVLAPFCFNVVLEEILLGNPTLRAAIEKQSLLAFADDVIGIADDIEEAR